MLATALLVTVSAEAAGASARWKPARHPHRWTPARRTPPATPTVAPPSAPGTLLLAEDFESQPEGAWADGSTHGQWVSTYNGFGTNAITSDAEHGKVLELSPKASTENSETHAGLVTSVSKLSGDLDLTATMRTVQQLRTPTPNTWEVPWLIWHYTDDHHFYYATLKPNGFELGKEDPAYPGAQRFLVTSGSPAAPVGDWHTIRVVQRGTTITVWADGSQVASFTDAERPYTSGSVGLYTEDASVRISDVRAVTP